VTRARLLAGGLFAALAAAGCGGSSPATPPAAFQQPSSIAAFQGYTIDAPSALRPYFAVANANRNDLALVDALDDTPVDAPIDIRSVVIPVPERPALLAAASLGDGKADLLVVVAGGDSVVQVVTTWDPSNVVHSDPAAATPLAVDLGADVLALAAVPSPPGTARVAAALAGRRLAVVEYEREIVATDPEIVRGEAIALVSSTVTAPLDFQPLALAALPDDPAVDGVQTELYAATLDEVAPGVFGVAAIPATLDVGGLRPLDARGPTRLVAAALLRERDGTSTAHDVSAFPGGPVPRVYAVLDEGGCGRTRRIDCGVVTLDPTKTTGGDAIPEDWAGRMAYRAPIRLPARPLAIAVARPTAAPPSPELPVYQDPFMRLFAGATERVTTGVAAVPTEDGSVYFLDLGRFETTLNGSPLAARGVVPPGLPTPVAVPPDDPNTTTPTTARLWFVSRDRTAFPATGAEAADEIDVTPGYTPRETFTIAYQGLLPDLGGLSLALGPTATAAALPRLGEAALHGSGAPWIALQVGEGPPAPGRAVREVVRLFHPALGVHPGDLVVIQRAGIEPAPPAENPACPADLELAVAEILEPAAEYPGGAVLVTPPSPTTACYEALLARIGSTGVTGLSISIRASGLVLTGALAGYAGRPQLGVPFRLEYPEGTDEDALAAACPIADWDGEFPVTVDATCGGGGCDRSATGACEQLVLARQARRSYHLSWPCDGECEARFPGVTFPQGNGPVIAFEVNVQLVAPELCATPACAAPDKVARDMSVSVGVNGGVGPPSAVNLLGARPTPAAPFRTSGAISFDRSPVSPGAGYRFLVAYPSDLVYDVSPSVNPVDQVLIR
jgi:hypothetical protein